MQEAANGGSVKVKFIGKLNSIVKKLTKVKPLLGADEGSKEKARKLLLQVIKELSKLSGRL